MNLRPVFLSLCRLVAAGTLLWLGACKPSSSELARADMARADTVGPSKGAPSGALDGPGLLDRSASAESSKGSTPVVEPKTAAPAVATEPSRSAAAHAKTVAPAVATEPSGSAAAHAEAPLPELGLAHDTPHVDYLDQALRKIDRDDLVGAFVALRRHLHDRPATVGVLLELASIGRRLGEVDIARTALLRAEEIEASSVVAIELARLHLEDGDPEGARQAAKRAVRRDRTDPRAFNQLGRIEMAVSQWQRAELAFRHALELDPTEAIVHNNIGLLYVRMRKGASAVDALETAVELFGDSAPHFVFNNLGLAYELTGDLPAAREAFEEALLVQPFYSRAKVNLERVERALAGRETAHSVLTAQRPESVAAHADGEAGAEETFGSEKGSAFDADPLDGMEDETFVSDDR